MTLQSSRRPTGTVGPSAISPDPATDGTRDRQPTWAVAVLILGGIAYIGLFAQAILAADDDLLQALTVAPILFGITVPIALRVARRDRDGGIATIILAGAAAKLLFAYVQFEISYGYYAGRVDAQQYHSAGETLAPAFRRLDFTTDLGGSLIGTGYTKIITGGVYAIVGTSRPAGFLVFGWFSFLGLLLAARAFRVGIPTGDGRRYLIAVLFMPSLLYWPASIGKEAVMLLGLGASAFGIAHILRGRATGVPALAGGLGLILLIRPHVALILLAGLAFAVLVRRAPARTYAAPLFRFLGIMALIALAFFLMSRTSSFLDTKLDSTSLSDQLAETETATTEAGSSFTPATVRTPLDIPWATVTVLFRPFPQEAGNFAGLLSAGEGILVLGLLAASAGRIRSVPRMIRTTPYLAFSLGYVFAFVIAFSRFANFGILARQRVQVIPFLLVVIALPRLRDLIAPAPAAPTEPAQAPAPVRRPAATSGTRRRLRPPPTPGRTRQPVSSGPVAAPPSRPID